MKHGVCRVSYKDRGAQSFPHPPPEFLVVNIVLYLKLNSMSSKIIKLCDPTLTDQGGVYTLPYGHK